MLPTRLLQPIRAALIAPVAAHLIALVCWQGDQAQACTQAVTSLPEIEIEVEFEDYDSVRDRLMYKIEVEAELMVPSQPAVCQCGLTFGSMDQQAPDSFRVLAAAVGVSKDEGDDFDLEAFAGFNDDPLVEQTIVGLRGARPGSTTFGFSTNVEPFALPTLAPGDAYVLGFLIEFAPKDFDLVNGNLVQFAAGSNEPGHPLALFQRYQPNLRLPTPQLFDCDVNLDQVCNVEDLDAFYALGQLDRSFPRTDATEKFDLDGDDTISFADVDVWLSNAAKHNGLVDAYDYGDANLDGAFNSTDLIQVFRAGSYESGRVAGGWSEGDWNGDGRFTSADLIRSLATGAYEGPAEATLATVPEPVSASGSAYILLGLLSLLTRRRRQQLANAAR